MHVRFLITWCFIFITGLLLFQVRREQLAYLHTQPEIWFDEDVERVIVNFKLKGYLYDIELLRFPSKFQSRQSEDCEVIVVGEKKIVKSNRGCHEVSFALKNVASLREIYSRIATPYLLLSVTGLVVSLNLYANLLIGGFLFAIYCFWILMLNKFNFWMFPIFSVMFYGVTIASAWLSSRVRLASIGSLKLATKIYLGLSAVLMISLYLKLSSTIFHPDEPGKIRQIYELLSAGVISRDYFLHPLMLIKSGAFFSGLITDDLTYEYISKTARLPSLISYLFTGLLIYLTGKRLYDKESAWFAMTSWFSFLLPFLTGSAIKEDMLLVSWIALNFYALIRYRSDTRFYNLVLVFVSAACAVSAKYTGLITVLYSCFFTAFFNLLNDGFNFRSLLKTVISVVFGLGFVALIFALVNGVWEYDLSQFVSGFQMESGRINMGHFNVFIHARDYVGLFYFFENFWRYENFVPAFLAILSIIIVWRKVTVEILVLICLLFGYYVMAEYTSGKAFPQPHRYLLPCYVFLSIIAGKAVAETSLGRILLIFQLVVSIYFKLELALNIDTRQVSQLLVNAVTGNFERVAYFVYSFPLSRSENKTLLQIERSTEVLSREDFDKPVLIVWNSFYCERFYRGRLRRVSWSRLVQCEVFKKAGVPIAKIGNSFLSKPFLEPEIEFRMIESYQQFVIVWNVALRFALLAQR